MHSLWNGVAGWGPHRVVSRLFLRESGLQGSGSDEAVVHEISLAMRDRHGMDPYVGGRDNMIDDASTPLVDLAVRRGLHEGGISRENLRDQSCPSKLLPAAKAAVDRAMQQGHGGALAPLPVFREDARTVAKRRAGSTVRDSVAAWLQSKEAEEWRRDRQALFPGAEVPAQSQM